MSSSPPKTPSPPKSSSCSDADQEATSNSQVPKSFEDLPRISPLNIDPEDIHDPIDSWLKKKEPLVDQNTLKNQPDKSIDTEQCTTSIGLALDEVSRNDLLPEKQQSVMVRPQKPSAFMIKNLVSPPLAQRSPASNRISVRLPAPHLRKTLNQEEETASGNLRKPTRNSRIVKSPQEITTARKPQPWWKKNVRKEMEDRILMPPPPPRQPLAVNKKVQAPEKAAVIQEEFKRKLDFPEENEQELPIKKRKFKPPEVDKKPARELKLKGPARKGGEENRFLFVSSENESEDDFVTLKFLTVYVLNGGNLAPKFERAIVNFINEALAENCKITVLKYRNKVMDLRRKFLHLVEQNGDGGEDFTEADFPTGLDYEMAEMCKIVWRERQESWGFGSFAGPKSNVGRGSDEVKVVGDIVGSDEVKLVGDIVGSDEVKLVGDIVGNDEVKLVGDIVRRVEEFKLAGAGVIVDQGNRGGADLRVDLDHGNLAGTDTRMNINQGNEAGAEQRVNIDHGNGAGADTGVNIDHGNGAGADQGLNIDHGNGAGANQGVNIDDGIGSRADQKKDIIMDMDEKPVGLSDTLTEHNARDGTPRPWKVYSRRPNLTKVSKKGPPQGSKTGGV